MPDALTRLTDALAGRYRIERELGHGGMATVYLAEDLRHQRQVAVKVLRPELAAVIGAERFLTEIKTTANLQHPHILPLFDSGEAGGSVFYVMPFVEGESLRGRIGREHQLPVDEALQIAREVADALEYAHGHGVVHRDIKPENILLHGGHALVADFGIALAVSRSDGGTRMTETGMSLGTPHYMSPEQAMGEREITARSDVYALGCVLYEMLTGDPPFTGSTAQAIVARVMTEPPRSLTLQRHTIPPHVEAAVITALEKLPADRYPSAAKFAEALVRPELMRLPDTRAATAVRPAASRPGRARAALVLPWLAAGLGLAAAAWGWLRPAPVQPVARYRIGLEAGQALQNGQGPRLAISPDGARFVFVGPGEGGGQLWVRERDQLAARPIAGTAGAICPFFSPDGRRVGFYTVSPIALKVVSLGGEPPVTVADSGIDWDGGSWGPDNYLYSDSPTGLVRVRPGGGPLEQMATFDTTKLQTGFNYVDALPGGRGVLFTIWHTTGSISDYEIGVLDLRTKTVQSLTKGVYARYAAPGYLVYVTAEGVLLAAPFDPERLRLTGPPTALAEGVNVRAFGWVDLSLSANGTLLYLSGTGGGATTDLVWVNRSGTAVSIDSGAFDSPALSPDGRRLAVAVQDRNETHIWVRQVSGGPLSKLSFEGKQDARPVWTADGRSVTFTSDRGRNRDLYTQRADGSAPAVLQLDRAEEMLEATWSRDGRWLVVRQNAMPNGDLFAFRPGVDSAPTPLVTTRFGERVPTLSPDGRWLAYVSNEAGRNEVYVRPFPDADRAKWQVSLNGGSEPRWAHSGREIFYRNVSGGIVAVAVSTQPTFSVGRQTELFPGSAFFQDDSHVEYDVAPDDQRFLMLRQRGGGERADLILVENWFTELRAKAGKPSD
ncbi:MAG: protein kinase domain-containing protein [Gemmatimonadales bacterium]